MKQFLKTLLASFIGAFLAFGLVTLFVFAILGSMLSFADSSTPVVPSSAILKLDFSQAIGERTAGESFDMGSFSPIPGLVASSNTIGILDFVKAIGYAAEDPNIKMIYINTDNLASDLSHIEEVRNALAQFRSSGKPIIAYGMNFTQGGYYLASVADKVYVHPLGMGQIMGVSSNLLFFKSALDLLGVDIQLIRHGKYKSAGEQFINKDISEANREQNQVMVNSLWNTIADAVCASRGISKEEFNAKVDNLQITTPKEMMEARLIDSLLTKEQLTNNICSLLGVKKEEDLKTISIGKYAKARIKPNIKAKNKIAIIYADGEIVLGKGEGIASDTFAGIIKKVRKDSTIKAVVFRVNSPGGSAQASELIRDELMLLKEKKPVIASYGSYAASGGYWISANADKIYTDHTTLTGSIGVFSLVPSFGKVISKLGVNSVPISSNKHSDMYSLMRPLDNAEVASMQKDVENIYDKFLSIVSEGRDMAVNQVDNIAQGRVWAGSDALGINLVNEMGGLIDALNYAAVAADLADYRLVEYPAVKSSIDKLMESMGQAKVVTEKVANPEKAIQEIYEEIKANNGVYARLPYNYQFNLR